MGMKLVIEIADDGRMNMEGPLHNKVLCYGLLQAGMDVVREYKPAEAPRIQVVPGMAAVNGPV